MFIGILIAFGFCFGCAVLVVIFLKRSEWNVGETEGLIDDTDFFERNGDVGSGPDRAVWDRDDANRNSNEELGS